MAGPDHLSGAAASASIAADASVACLSCVFDYEGAELAYRHAYALDTCRRAIPPERDLATVMPLG